MAEKLKDTRRKRVLYFDDEPFYTQAQAMSLELLGWDVTKVSEIDELFKELKYSKFDIIILDLMAPLPNEINKYISFTSVEIEAMDGGMNTGVALAKRIWELHGTLPILFMSANRFPENAKEDFNHNGFKWGYLRKPELAKTVDAELIKLLNS